MTKTTPYRRIPIAKYVNILFTVSFNLSFHPSEFGIAWVKYCFFFFFFLVVCVGYLRLYLRERPLVMLLVLLLVRCLDCFLFFVFCEFAHAKNASRFSFAWSSGLAACANALLGDAVLWTFSSSGFRGGNTKGFALGFNAILLFLSLRVVF